MVGIKFMTRCTVYVIYNLFSDLHGKSQPASSVLIHSVRLDVIRKDGHRPCAYVSFRPYVCNLHRIRLFLKKVTVTVTLYFCTNFSYVCLHMFTTFRRQTED